MIPKYRAWHIAEKRMLEVKAIDFINQEIEERHLGAQYQSWDYSFSDVILMQSTDLLDANDKEIFEGDIVKGIHGCIARVIFENGQFICDHPYIKHHLRKEDNCGDSLCSKFSVVIIGNIHEHPDLLETAKC